MERINLLPEDLTLTPVNRFIYSVNQRFFPTLGRTLAAAAGLVFLVAVIQIFLTQHYLSSTDRVKQKKAKAAVELKKMSGTVARLSQRETELLRQMEWQNERVQYLRTYQDSAGEWSPVLEEVKSALPFGVWLTELEADPKRTLRVAGGAFEEDLVVKFMGALKETPKFRDVAFNFTKKAIIGKTGVVQFEIVSKVAGPPEPAEGIVKVPRVTTP